MAVRCERAARMARYDALDPRIREVVRESPWDVDVARADDPAEIIAYVERRWYGVVKNCWGARHPDARNRKWVRA